MIDTITKIDFQILYWIQEHCKCRFLDAVMPFITHLGSYGIFWIMLGFALILTQKYRKCGINMLSGMLIGLIIGNMILKNAILRERPCWIDETIPMLIAIPKDYSFPSGHTTSSVIASLVIFHEDKKLGTIALILTCMIAFSRMYLFVHFPTDILAGAILGATIGIITPIFIEKWAYPKFSKPKPE
ncbi:MAG: phosphatase PAP2 family protein [Oscillospiraceae bacterium]